MHFKRTIVWKGNNKVEFADKGKESSPLLPHIQTGEWHDVQVKGLLWTLTSVLFLWNCRDHRGIRTGARHMAMSSASLFISVVQVDSWNHSFPRE